MMQPTKVLLSLITQSNDYQRASAASAEAAATRLGVSLEVVYAENDAVNQVQQILTATQRRNHVITAVITEPVGTGMRSVAESCVKAGIGWCVMNRDVDYMGPLRGLSSAPVYRVSVDQTEVGRIQAEQVEKLLPAGGTVLYIVGPASGSTAALRSEGFMTRKPTNIEVKTLRGNWTQESGHQAVSSWLKLRTSRSADFVAIVSQNDAMAIGARRAFGELSDRAEMDHWLAMPFLGCDGLPETGQMFVQRKLLTATVCTPAVSGTAIELLCASLAGGPPLPECSYVKSTSFPVTSLLHPLVVKPPAGTAKT